MCLDDIKLVLVDSFLQRSAHSIYDMFSLYFDSLLFRLNSNFGFDGWTLVLIASVQGSVYHLRFKAFGYAKNSKLSLHSTTVLWNKKGHVTLISNLSH